VRRVEDQRFITGSGRYTEYIDLEGQVYGCVVRSPEAHARIKALDIEAAKAAPEVLAVITGADIEANGSDFLPCGIPMENRWLRGHVQAAPGAVHRPGPPRR
jgi:aerobic carbon-monoxide dehydrogenase large subunit